ncbi:unnamed protein product [Adineta steineri]|uniref:Zinc-binding loop region of homing endonuclease domain-containing protein n=1 Tax=Adineta steineri TaxID=433720 RepID=A0A816DK41_9BILA|nr:unnamed protein product [Adineta steineri]CAF1637049.1 unnamed protein product [Adineta steineri]
MATNLTSKTKGTPSKPANNSKKPDTIFEPIVTRSKTKQMLPEPVTIIKKPETAFEPIITRSKTKQMLPEPATIINETKQETIEPPTTSKGKKQETIEPPTTSKGKKQETIEPSTTSEIPVTQEFLNSISKEVAKEFINRIYERTSCDFFTNDKHIFPSIDLEELETMGSIRDQNGDYLTKWMRCYGSPDHTDQSLPNHPRAHLRSGCNSHWPESVQDAFNKFAEAKEAKVKEQKDKEPKGKEQKDKGPLETLIYSHHIVLRSKLDKLPLLSRTKAGYQASHLCDTKGCLSESHLIVETFEQNQARKSCQGIFVHIHKYSDGKKEIIQVEPCQHGIGYRSEPDPFKYSCRKMKIMMTDDNKLKYLCG